MLINQRIDLHQTIMKLSFKLLVALPLLTALISSCASHIPPLIIKVNSVDDIPDINTVYKRQITELKVGMSKGQVLAIFPNVEKECYANSEICHFTVFDEKLLQIDKRLGDVNVLTGSLVSLLAITCLISDDDCPEAIIAAFHVGIASALESQRIKNDIKKDGIVSLIQWINIEFERGKVKQWAINEPLSQFRPKTYSNELPPLDEALKTSNN